MWSNQKRCLPLAHSLFRKHRLQVLLILVERAAQTLPLLQIIPCLGNSERDKPNSKSQVGCFVKLEGRGPKIQAALRKYTKERVRLRFIQVPFHRCARYIPRNRLFPNERVIVVVTRRI